MAVFAAVMTGPGTGAVATIQLFGDRAGAILESVFNPAGGKPLPREAGGILLGHIVDGDRTLDQVTIGCEASDSFAIHCHGNPLIVEMIMQLLRRCGVTLVLAEQLLGRMHAADNPRHAIGIEAKLALTTVKTVEGARLIAHQVEAGLTQKARQWLQEVDSRSLPEIAAEAARILKDSDAAGLIVSGCTVALIGPANTGKSTLLNTLAGRDKAIVTDIKGTTRDWVSADIHIPPLLATIIDTAGLDADLAAAENAPDEVAQRKSIEILDRADVVLLVLDGSRPAGPRHPNLVERLSGRRVVAVLNKADLPTGLDPAAVPDGFGQVVRISARDGTGIDDLVRAIHQACGVVDFDLHAPIAFTDRQRPALDRLSLAASRPQARAVISELLEGPLSV